MPNISEFGKYKLWEYRGWNTSDYNGFWCSIYVYDVLPKKEDEYFLIEKTLITNFAIITKFGHQFDSKRIEDDIVQSTIDKVKARLSLSLFDKGEENIQEITTDTLNDKLKTLDDEIIQSFLLKGLKNYRKEYPDCYKISQINVKGFCDILRISKYDYQYNAGLLIEDNLIGADSTENAIEEGYIFITSSGIKLIDERTRKEEIRRISSRNLMKEDMTNNEKYDIAISFAGEDRQIVEQIADKLLEKRIKVFYDSYEEAHMWGKNLYDYLSDVYGDKSRFCLMIISGHYKDKLWTNHERESAQARAFRENREYILPLRLDDTKIPGIHETVGYIDIRNHSIDDIVELLIRKLK